jgi:hypothetical protein
LNAQEPSTSTTRSDGTVPLGRKQQEYAVKTWHYLRLAMIALVAALAAAVVYELIRAGCRQTSISAYYYTHARTVFVGALIAIGTCLICLRGSTEWEDVLLNFAGLLAPVVALVPTPDAGHCASLPVRPTDRTSGIENNLTALLVVGGLVLIAAIVLSWRRNRRPPTRIGYVVAVVLWLVVLTVFLVARKWLVQHAHGLAAPVMFLCIIAVAVLNGIGFRRKQGDRKWHNRYIYTAILMPSAFLLRLVGGKYRVLWAEVDALLLFAIFWGIQTEELRREGLRPAEPGRRPPSAPTGTPAS